MQTNIEAIAIDLNSNYALCHTFEQEIANWLRDELQIELDTVSILNNDMPANTMVCFRLELMIDGLHEEIFICASPDFVNGVKLKSENVTGPIPYWWSAVEARLREYLLCGTDHKAPYERPSEQPHFESHEGSITLTFQALNNGQYNVTLFDGNKAPIDRVKSYGTYKLEQAIRTYERLYSDHIAWRRRGDSMED